MNKHKTIYLIDGSSYIYRAFHAIRGLTNSKGLPTNAVFGFTRMLLKLMDDHAPVYAAMVFDTKGPTFRHLLYIDYKANRPPMPDDMSVQIPYIKDVTKAFGVPIIEMDGFEADDVIGTIACGAANEGFEAILVTGDKDFLQLVSPTISIWDPMKDKTITYDSVCREYELEPFQIIDMMGLSGDSADNVPGVPGIGPKTALSLVRSFGSLESIYENLNNITKKKQLENLTNYKEQAFLSRKLVTIDTQVPLSVSTVDFRLQSHDEAKLAELYEILEFNQLKQNIPNSYDPEIKKYQAIYTPKELSELLDKLNGSPLFALDTETTSQNPMKAEIVGLSFALQANEAFYIPCRHDYLGAPQQLDLAFVLNEIKPILENPDKKKVGQNIKYDWIVLERNGIRLAGAVFDTMLASYLLNPSKRAHNLDRIALDFLNHKTITYQDVAGKGKDTKVFSKVFLEEAIPYACEDADITLMAYRVLVQELQKKGLSELFDKVEMPLVQVLMKGEMVGICVDQNILKQLSSSFERQLARLEEEIFHLAGEKFNIRSSQQLGAILFEKLNLPILKKTKKKTGYSTDVDVLTSLAEQHELPVLLLRYRTLSKLKSTYADALLSLVNPDTGRIHTSFNQTVTATGRLSSSGPNLPNIPIRTKEGREIRAAFVPRNRWSFVSADYSQIELRILAHYSNDPILIEAFQKNEDIHTRTASEVFQLPADLITADLRLQAKIINFGIIYGMGAFSLSKELGISHKMAQTYIDSYFVRYEGVKRFIDQTIAEARQSQQTGTLLGRLRFIPEINSSNRNIRSFAERIAVNTPIQGTAADLIKVAMIHVDSVLEQRNLKSLMLLSVHDELLFEVPPGEIDLLSFVVRETMEEVWKFSVPLKVNLAVGKSWAESH